MRRGEVKFLLDKFEEGWVEHMSFKALVLKRYANMTKDMPLQVDMDEAKPEITLDDMEDRVAEELKLGRFRTRSADPVKQARVAFRWGRLSVIRGNAFSQFNSAKLIEACKHNKNRKYKRLNEELAREADNLQRAKENLASLSPDLSQFLYQPGASAPSMPGAGVNMDMADDTMVQPAEGAGAMTGAEMAYDNSSAALASSVNELEQMMAGPNETAA